jgi:hypothetical protein
LVGWCEKTSKLRRKRKRRKRKKSDSEQERPRGGERSVMVDFERQ